MCNVPIGHAGTAWEIPFSMEHHRVGNLISVGTISVGRVGAVILRKMLGNLGGATCQVKATNQWAGKINS